MWCPRAVERNLFSPLTYTVWFTHLQKRSISQVDCPVICLNYCAQEQRTIVSSLSCFRSLLRLWWVWVSVIFWGFSTYRMWLCTFFVCASSVLCSHIWRAIGRTWTGLWNRRGAICRMGLIIRFWNRKTENKVKTLELLSLCKEAKATRSWFEMSHNQSDLKENFSMSKVKKQLPTWTTDCVTMNQTVYLGVSP